MAPHLGAGAGQGIEDAYLLAQLLSDPRVTKANVAVRGIKNTVTTWLTYISAILQAVLYKKVWGLHWPNFEELAMIESLKNHTCACDVR